VGFVAFMRPSKRLLSRMTWAAPQSTAWGVSPAPEASQLSTSYTGWAPLGWKHQGTSSRVPMAAAADVRARRGAVAWLPFFSCRAATSCSLGGRGKLLTVEDAMGHWSAVLGEKGEARGTACTREPAAETGDQQQPRPSHSACWMPK
jgi:hypothetical protein